MLIYVHAYTEPSPSSLEIELIQPNSVCALFPISLEISPCHLPVLSSWAIPDWNIFMQLSWDSCCLCVPMPCTLSGIEEILSASLRISSLPLFRNRITSESSFPNSSGFAPYRSFLKKRMLYPIHPFLLWTQHYDLYWGCAWGSIHTVNLLNSENAKSQAMNFLNLWF